MRYGPLKGFSAVMSGKWESFVGEGKAKFAFTASGKYQISLQVEEHVYMEEVCAGWFKGSRSSDNKQGMFPVAYIIVETKLPTETEFVNNNKKNTKKDTLFEDVNKAIRDWTKAMMNHFQDRTKYFSLQQRIDVMSEWRRLVWYGNSVHELDSVLRVSMVQLIEASRQIDSGFIVPREETGKLIEFDCSLLKMFELYDEIQSVMENSSDLPDKASSVELHDSFPESKASILIRQLYLREIQYKGEGILSNYALEKIFDSRTSSNNVKSHNELRLDSIDTWNLNFEFISFSIASPADIQLELYFSVFANGGFQTEEFLVCWKRGTAKSTEGENILKTHFTDLELSDFKDTYLFCRIVRKGKLVESGNDHKLRELFQEEAIYRRPFGTVAWALSPNDVREKEILLTGFPIVIGASKEFPLHEMLLNNLKLLPQSPTGLSPMTVKLKAVPALDKKTALNPAPMNKLYCTPRNSLYFPTLADRNDLYITLERGRFLQDGKRAPKNVQVRMLFYSNDGKAWPCLIQGNGYHSSLQSEFRSVVYYHKNDPDFIETVRLSMQWVPPAPELKDCHILLLFYHASTNPKKTHVFSFSFLKLTDENGVVIPDATYDLCCFKPWVEMERGEIPKYLIKKYIQESAIKGHSSGELVVREKETFAISTKMCSNVKTQNTYIDKLVKWRHNPSEEFLLNVISNICSLPSDVIMGQCLSLLDCALSILDYNEPKIVNASFTLLLFIFASGSEFSSKRFSKFIEYYIEDRFSKEPFCASTYVTLLKGFRETIEQFGNDLDGVKDTSVSYPAAVNLVKGLPVLVQFILTSRSKVKSDGQNFRILFCEAFESLNAILEFEFEVQFPYFRILILKSLLDTVNIGEKQLCGPLLPENVVQIVSNSIEATRGSMNLEYILNLSKTFLVQNKHCRSLILGSVVQALKEQFTCDQEELLTNCIKAFLYQVQTSKESGNEIWNISMLLPEMVEFQSSGNILGICGLAIIQDMTAKQKQYFMSTVFTCDKSRSVFATSLLKMCLRFVNTYPQKDVFPKPWLLANGRVISTIIDILKWLSAWFQKQLGIWKLVLHVSWHVIQIPVLQSECPYFDVEFYRQDLLSTMKRSWEDVPLLSRFELITPLAKLVISCCIHLEFEDFKQFSRQFYFDLVQSEIETSGIVRSSELEAVSFIDSFWKTPTGILKRQRLDELFTVHSRSKDRGFVSPVLEGCMQRVSQFHNLLNSLHRLPARDPIYENDYVDILLDILEYLTKTIQANAMAASYTMKLATYHENSDNYAEAGNSLLAYCEEFTEEKMQFLQRASKLFQKGRLWESAISALNLCRQYYEWTSFQYDHVSEILSEQATLFMDMSKSRGRYYPSYFRVTFWSKKGSDQQMFIFKGNDVENLSDFANRLSARHPTIHVALGTIAGQEARSTQDDFIEIITILPCKRSDLVFLAESAHSITAPLSVQTNHEYSNIWWFGLIKSHRKRSAKSGNEALDSWAEKSYFKVSHAFPGNTRRASVVETSIRLIDPLRIAVEAIYMKTLELKERVRLYRHATASRTTDQSFSLLLSGMIDSPVNGGVIKNYGPFFDGSYKTEYPEIVQAFSSSEEADALVETLRGELRQQLPVVQEALEVHSKVCPESMLPLHDHLTRAFEDLKLQYESIF